MKRPSRPAVDIWLAPRSTTTSQGAMIKPV